METGKILITVQFIGREIVSVTTSGRELSSPKMRRIELMLPRDITFAELLDCLLYGLEKKIKLKAGDGDGTVLSYEECKSIFDSAVKKLLKQDSSSGFTGRIILSMVDKRKLEENGIDHGMTITVESKNKNFSTILDTDSDRRLCDLGINSAAHILFLEEGAILEDETQNTDESRICEAYKVLESTGKQDSSAKVLPLSPEVLYPEVNISTRSAPVFDRSPIEIIPPQNPPQKQDQNFFLMLLPTVISVAVMMGARMMMGQTGGGGAMMLMSSAMGLSGVILSIITFFNQKKKYRKSLADWKEQYETYLARVVGKIVDRQEAYGKKLKESYKSAKELVDEEVFINGDLFSRTPSHDDFLSLSLGLTRCPDKLDSNDPALYPGSLKTPFPVVGPKRDEVFSPAYFFFEKDVKEEMEDTNTDKNKEKKGKKEGKSGKAKDKTDPAEAQQNKPGSVSVIKYTIDLIDEKKGKMEQDKEYLSMLPADIAEKFRYMPYGTPFLYSLRQCGVLGVVSGMYRKDKYRYRLTMGAFVERMVLELSYYHSPEDLQFVIFFPEPEKDWEKEAAVSSYAHLPHCRELLDGCSQFVFSRESASTVLSAMLPIMEARSGGETAGNLPHIVFIVQEEYGLREHAFAAFLPKAPADGTPFQNRLGITFVFLKDRKEYLPKYCTDTIRIDRYNAKNTGVDSATVASYDHSREDVSLEFDFLYGASEGEPWRKAWTSFRMLSGAYYTRIAQSRQVPSSVSLFELLGKKQDELESYITGNWDADPENDKSRDITETLSVPLGKSETGTIELDLHERGDGPHMVVAGTTGSGKTETVLSYLISLCMKFPPSEVNLMLVDMKGGGFTKRLGSLPHVVGTVTDIDGDENNTGAEYMLKRFLFSIKEEVRRRKRVINHFPDVDSIDGYVRKIRELKAKRSDGKADDGVETELKYIRDNPLPHLFLVVDEFTELKRFSAESGEADYMGEITTIARIGRSLGIHIILISQNIEGAITDDIRVNVKSRLCLRVATKQASKEMIGNELAASPSMPGNGRAYLMVGTGSRFVYFQSAYSGLAAEEKASVNLIVTEAAKEGKYSVFYNAYEDNEKLRKQNSESKETQLTAAVDAVKKVFEEGSYPAVRTIFRQPLPEVVVYPDTNF